MVTVRKATLDLFDQIHPLLLHFRDARLDRDQWRRLLSRRWSRHHDHCGYVLMKEGRVVGFLGTLFFERTMEGTEHRFCDLFCWIVPPEHRHHSLLLLFPVLKLQNTTVMSLTPSGEASVILAKFGFRVLETHRVILPLFPLPVRCRGVRLVRGDDELRRRLHGQDLVLLRDHEQTGCHHLLLEAEGGGGCYVVANTIRKKGIPFTQVYHLGDPVLFTRGLPLLQRFFLRRDHTLFTLVDRRLLAGCRPRPAHEQTLRYPRLYRPAGPEPARIDNLYSELLLLRQ
ncbi:hypothetical protein ACLG6S_11215 [Thermodesulfobacteriota bacterium B35]